MNNLFDIVNTDAARIIRRLKDGDAYLRELAEDTGVPLSTAHKIIGRLEGSGMVRSAARRNRKSVSLERGNVYLRRVVALINMSDFMGCRAAKRLGRRGTVGVYGSFAEGTDDRLSDIDVWLFSEKRPPMEVRSDVRALEEELGRRVSLTILDPAKIKRMRENDPEFYYRLMLTSITMGDDPFGRY